MAEEVSFFNKLILDKWYKYLLYLGGILLIASLFSSSTITPSFQKFALYSIVIAVIMWVLSEIFGIAAEYALDKRDEEMGVDIAVLYSVSSVFALIIWVIVAVLPFASTIPL